MQNINDELINTYKYINLKNISFTRHNFSLLLERFAFLEYFRIVFVKIIRDTYKIHEYHVQFHSLIRKINDIRYTRSTHACCINIVSKLTGE